MRKEKKRKGTERKREEPFVWDDAKVSGANKSEKYLRTNNGSMNRM